ncbi:MAG: T9SS type A sorting domain-containing protein [Candidatus Cloacimonadota bacterium]|nr:MAG: T9SS type A sorting domain-containing protein [Candidatus Cloacimonadota bacterium]
MKTLWIVFMSCFIVFLFAANIFAQTPDTLWTRTYGGTEWDGGYSVQQTSDGGYIIAGYTMSFSIGFRDAWLLKTDANGDTIWTKTYGWGLTAEASSVQQTSDGGYIFAGYIESGGLGIDVWLIKTDANGDTMWTRTYDETVEDVAYSVQQTTDSGYIITGCIGFNSPDIYIIKTDINGDTLWTRIYGGGFIDTIDAEGNEVQQTSDGGYIIVGHKEIYNSGNRDLYLIKIDANGDSLWSKTYGGNGWDEGFSVQQTSDKGYIITGVTSPFVSGGDVYLVKTDSLGDTVWTRTYGGDSLEVGFSVQLTNDGGYVIVGGTSSFGSNWCNVYLVKTNSSGDTLWTRNYGIHEINYGNSIQQTSEGGYIIVGVTDSAEVDLDVYLLKIDSEGNIEEGEKRETEPLLKIIKIFPNPYSTFTSIKVRRQLYSTELRIFDISGRSVKNLMLPATDNIPEIVVTWFGKDKQGHEVPPGIYFLKADGMNVEKVVKVR